MAKLSVIIVNYNVKYFLEQALLSVRKAAVGLSVEVIVVDNNSVDGSNEMVKQKFPEVRLIANRDNVGFSVANNQGIAIAKGKYILLLNPDTVVEEDTFRKSVAFMDKHADAGALGVKMYDGKGIFLPESKRGLPTPLVAFYKIFGFGTLFPRSKHFNYYYLGHLDENETHEIEVLAGAFMLMPKKVLEEVGYLDETFFMYGEDIDLSYRITQAGYKNYYFPHTRIIHYKGESTKKGSLNYVRVFYNAMIIFARKHFSAEKARFYVWAIQIAIYLRAFLSMIQSVANRILMPLFDAAWLYGGMYLIKDFWQNNIKAAEGVIYQPEYMFINIPLYIAIWLTMIFLSGGYDKPMKTERLVRGILVGSLVIAAVYGFLPESLRSSRGMIVAGTVWAVFTLSSWRLGFNLLRYKRLDISENLHKKAIIVGSFTECKRVQLLLHQANVSLDLIGYVDTSQEQTDEKNNSSQQFLGYLYQLKEVIEIYKIEEIIFCAKDVESQKIIQYMIDIGANIDYKIVPEDSLSIIGSNSKNTAGDLYTIDINLNLNEKRYQRNKRLFDVLSCMTLLFLIPFLFFFLKNKIQFIANWFAVLIGKKSWVGYAESPANEVASNDFRLPKIKKGVLSPLDALPQKAYNQATTNRLNLLYAKDYSSNTDFDIVWQAWQSLGKK
ncbi:MAG: glycosyltransferase family 2 protein [Chitinophagales bacterium]